jgi:hypothetical protein
MGAQKHTDHRNDRQIFPLLVYKQNYLFKSGDPIQSLSKHVEHRQHLISRTRLDLDDYPGNAGVPVTRPLRDIILD